MRTSLKRNKKDLKKFVKVVDGVKIKCYILGTVIKET